MVLIKKPLSSRLILQIGLILLLGVRWTVALPNCCLEHTEQIWFRLPLIRLVRFAKCGMLMGKFTKSQAGAKTQERVLLGL
jgi:hypothetical protein